MGSILLDLVTHAPVDLRRYLALSCRVEATLEALAGDPGVSVRLAVTRNNDTTGPIIERLMADASEEVKYYPYAIGTADAERSRARADNGHLL